MAHSHYVMDSFSSDGLAKPRREMMRIFAGNDAEDFVGAKGLDGWKQTTVYHVRSINSSARSGDKVIFTSRVNEPLPSQAT